MKYIGSIILLMVLCAGVQGQERTITLSSHKPAFQYTEAFLYSDSAEIKVNGKFFRYKPVRGRAVIGEVFGKGKKYKDGLTADKGGGADIVRVVDGNKIKETVVVNDTSIHSYKYILNTNMSISRVGDYIYLDSTVGYIAPPVGWDADSNAVNVTFELSGDTITYFWSKTDSAVTMNYPVSIDPTVIFNSNDSEDDPMAQGAPTTNYGGLDQIHMRGDSAGGDMLNGWIRFDIDSVAFTDSVASAKLFLKSKQANFGGSVTYSVHLVKVGLPVEAQMTWNIWKTSNNWNLAGARGGADIYYADPAPVTGHSFNAGGAGVADSVDITTLVRKIAGKDSSLANYGFLLLVTTRGNGNTIYYASSEHATAASRPYLKVVTVSTTVTLSCSLSYGATYDSIRVHAYGDTSLVDSTAAYKIVGTDTLQLTAWQVTPATTYFDSATGNQTYRVIVKGKTSSANYWSNKDTILTKPDTATTTIESFSSTTVRVTPLVGANNSLQTKMSLLDSTATKSAGSRRWFNLAGDTSLTERFYSSAQWSYITKDSGLAVGSWQIVAVRAQNDDSTYQSAFEIDSIQTAVGFDSAYFYAIDTNRVQTQIDFETFGAGDTIFIRIWDKVTNDTVKTDSFAYVSTLVRDTLTLPDSLNKKYGAIAFLKDTNNAIYKSDIDSFRTRSVKPASTSWTWATDTSGVFVATKHTTMPNNSGYFLVDSGFVSAGSSQVYLHPDSLGYFATKVYRSITSFNDTIKFPRTDLTTGGSIQFSLHAGNTDSTGAQ